MELNIAKDEKEDQEHISNTFDFPFGMDILQRSFFFFIILFFLNFYVLFKT